MSFKQKNKKGVVFTILGAFTLCGILYLFMIFLDFYNIMYAKIVFQGDVRASSLQAANYVDYDAVDSKSNAQNFIYIQSKTNSKYQIEDTAEYNAARLFDINYRQHYRLVKDSAANDFDINHTNPNLIIKVYNLDAKGDGTYKSVAENIPSFSHIIHTEPGVTVYSKLTLKSWTFFFKGYTIESYSYSSPILVEDKN